MSVVSKTAETNALRPYFVSALAGPRLARRRVAKGERVEMTEHQARALLASGELVDEEAKVDDPLGEVARAKAADDAAAAAKAQADKDAADAKAAADRAAAEAKAAADKAATDAKAAAAKGKPADAPVPPAAG